MNKIVGVQIGMNVFFFVGVELVMNKFSLQDCFIVGCGNVVVGSVYKVAIGYYFFY